MIRLDCPQTRESGIGVLKIGTGRKGPSNIIQDKKRTKRGNKKKGWGNAPRRKCFCYRGESWSGAEQKASNAGEEETGIAKTTSINNLHKGKRAAAGRLKIKRKEKWSQESPLLVQRRPGRRKRNCKEESCRSGGFFGRTESHISRSRLACKGGVFPAEKAIGPAEKEKGERRGRAAPRSKPGKAYGRAHR